MRTRSRTGFDGKTRKKEKHGWIWCDDVDGGCEEEGDYVEAGSEVEEEGEEEAGAGGKERRGFWDGTAADAAAGGGGGGGDHDD